MDIKDIKPSSYYDSLRDDNEKKSKDLPAPAEKIIKGEVNAKRESAISKILNQFIPNDINSVRDYVIEGVVVPAIKEAVMDAVRYFLFQSKGEKRPNSWNGNPDKPSYVNYVNYSKNSGNQSQQKSGNSGPSVEYRMLNFSNELDAREVLNDLVDQIDMYQKTSIGHLFDIIGKPTTSSMFDYGWRTLASAEITRERDGSYTLELPRAVPLD